MEFTLEEKLNLIFNSGYSISFQNEIRRKNSEWYIRITWRCIQQPNNSVIKECSWFGFDNINECTEDCLASLTINSI